MYYHTWIGNGLHACVNLKFSRDEEILIQNGLSLWRFVLRLVVGSCTWPSNSGSLLKFQMWVWTLFLLLSTFFAVFEGLPQKAWHNGSIRWLAEMLQTYKAESVVRLPLFVSGMVCAVSMNRMDWRREGGQIRGLGISVGRIIASYL